jgi:hypothetical protein
MLFQCGMRADAGSRLRRATGSGGPPGSDYTQMLDDIHDTPKVGKAAKVWESIRRWMGRGVRTPQHYVGVDSAAGEDVQAVTVFRRQPDGSMRVDWSKAGPLTEADRQYLRGLLSRSEYERLTLGEWKPPE